MLAQTSSRSRSLIGFHRPEPVSDFPDGFENAVSYSYIELNQLMKDPKGYRTHVEKVVEGLESIAEKGHTWPPVLFPCHVCALRVIDDVYCKWRNAEPAPTPEQAITRTREMAHYLEGAVHLVMEASEYEERMHLCITLSQYVSMYSGPIIRC